MEENYLSWHIKFWSNQPTLILVSHQKIRNLQIGLRVLVSFLNYELSNSEVGMCLKCWKPWKLSLFIVFKVIISIGKKMISDETLTIVGQLCQEKLLVVDNLGISFINYE